MMFAATAPYEHMIQPVICSESGCMIKSTIAEFKSMTIRTGLSYCIDHTNMNEITTKFKSMTEFRHMTLIFYDIELSRDGEIEQIGACTDSGENFSAFVRTTVRTNTSPFLRKITPKYWNMLAEEPKNAMMNFISWVKTCHAANPHSNGGIDDVMLAAHFGSCHDHVHLLKTMMKWGLTPPNYMLVDTLAIFKTIMSKTENAKLNTLVNKYVPWFDHVQHDADSDAEALKFVVKTAFPNLMPTCYAFAITCDDFMHRTTLSMFTPSPIVMFRSVSSNLVGVADSNTSPDVSAGASPMSTRSTSTF